MNYMVVASSMEGCKEFLLPEADNMSYEIFLEKHIFGLERSLTVELEAMDGIWRLVRGSRFHLRVNDAKIERNTRLEDRKVFYLKDTDDRQITLLVLLQHTLFPVFQKYDLHNISGFSIGKEEENEICCDLYGYISGRHAVFWKDGSKWIVRDASVNGSYLNHKKLLEPSVLNFGDELFLLGIKLIFLKDYLAVCILAGDCQVNEERLLPYHPRIRDPLPIQEADAEEKVYFKRSPRIVEQLYTEPVEIEAPPSLQPGEKRPLLLAVGPGITMAVPVLLGCLVSAYVGIRHGEKLSPYLFTGMVTAVSSVFIGTIWTVANLNYMKKEEKEKESLRYHSYARYLSEKECFIRQRMEENREILYRAFLSGQECCTLGRWDARLWNHNERQMDFLMVRLGIGSVPFQAEIRIPKKPFLLYPDELQRYPEKIKNNCQMLSAVPFCIGFREKGVIGIVGGAGKYGAYEVAKNIIAQLAANHCYTEVKLAFLYYGGPETERQWSFARWLPHVWLEENKLRLTAGNKAEIGDICYELAGILRRRTEDHRDNAAYPLPHFVVFVDGMEVLQGELLEHAVYMPRPEYGMTIVLLSERYEDLPNSCEEIIRKDEKVTGYYHIYDKEKRSRNLTFETVSEKELDQLSRRLCDIKTRDGLETAGEIPDVLGFLDLYEATAVEQLQVRNRWKRNRTYESMRVPIGRKAGGKICFLDIHEKYHGPHGLVAGTTGSGKSEVLQTWILSMAVNFGPEDITFLLIDFKGGGMANLFGRLPHLAGQISNLSGNQIHRAMVSIKSEIKRRQRIFAKYQVNHIDLYTRFYKEHKAEKPVPHLFILIDEFAELKREEPEFMKELISVAQVGRSLGVHLILATQKPGGTVDENIWSNSRFRLCLRVQDRQDSNDMLKKPDAVYITRTGRGYFQVGEDEIYEQFQAGYSGAAYIENARKSKSCVTRLTRTGQPVRSYNGRNLDQGLVNSEKTQLDAIIDHLAEIARTYGYSRSRSLWLPPLPAKLYLEDLQAYEKEGVQGSDKKHWHLGGVIGLLDDPESQLQKPLYISFAEAGHLAVYGMTGSGKSVFLQTLLYTLMNQYDSGELNFYILDYSSRLLCAFADTPHCGGVIVDTDTEKTDKFFYMLKKILEERKQFLGGGTYSQYRKKIKEKKEILPAVLVVIDHYAGFQEKTGSRFDSEILRIAREGGNYGIFLAISAAGTGSGELPVRIGEQMRIVIALELGDPFKYSEVLKTARLEIFPESGVKGRGVAYADGKLLEFQTALAVRTDDIYEIQEEIKTRGEHLRKLYGGVCAAKIPVIPPKPALETFSELTSYKELIESRRYIPVGYLTLDASVCAIDLWNTFCWFIQGHRRSGKKNVFRLLLHAAAQKEDKKIYLIDPGDKFKTACIGKESITYLKEEQEIYDFFKKTIPVFQKRNQKKQELLQKGLDGEKLAEQMNQETQFFIFISDMASFVKMVYEPEKGVGSMRAYLENITEKGNTHGFYFFGMLSAEQSFSLSAYPLWKNMVFGCGGIHLGGNTGRQQLFRFENIPFQEQGKITKPGIGLMVSSETPELAQEVVLPVVKGGVA